MRLKEKEWVYRSVHVVGIVIVLLQACISGLVLSLIGAILILIGFVGVWRVSVKQKRPRQLTPRQAERFVKILTGAPQRSIIIDALLGDQKAWLFATQLQFLFLTAGWQLGKIGIAQFEPPVFGVALQVKDLGSVDPRISAIQQAFNAVGISVEIKIGVTSTTNEIALQIGNEP